MGDQEYASVQRGLQAAIRNINGVQIFQTSTLEKSSENICEFLFSRHRTLFFYFGVFPQKVLFLKKIYFAERFLLRLEETSPTGFFLFLPKKILISLRYLDSFVQNFTIFR